MFGVSPEHLLTDPAHNRVARYPAADLQRRVNAVLQATRIADSGLTQNANALHRTLVLIREVLIAPAALTRLAHALNVSPDFFIKLEIDEPAERIEAELQLRAALIQSGATVLRPLVLDDLPAATMPHSRSSPCLSRKRSSTPPKRIRCPFSKSPPAGDPEIVESSDAGPGLGISLLATTRAYVAIQSATVKALGITTGTFNLRYRFAANGTSVTRSLECKAWWSGFSGLMTIDSSASAWISGGRGYCVGTHKMSMVYKASFLSGMKEQGISYNGKPTLLSNYIKNL